MFAKSTLVVILVLVSACAPQTYLKAPVSAESFFRYQSNKRPLISAHRGGGDYAGFPENCLESFEMIARKVPTIIECDIALTKDSTMVMMHDDTFNRTTTGTGKVSDATYDYVQTLQLKDNKGTLTKARIPTLEQVLRWGRNKVVFTLDVKRSVPFEKVVALINRTNASNYAAVITYNVADAVKVHRLAPEVMISVTIRNQAEYDRLHEAGIPDQRMIAFVGVKEPPQELYQFLHQKGISCILGVLGNLDKQALARGDSTYRDFVRRGADILSTDRPLEAAQALNSHQVVRM